MAAKRRVLVVGSANMDLVARAMHLPKPGESVMGSGFTMVPGGKGANQAVAAARLGAETRFAGCVGADSFGRALRKSLADSGVIADHLIEDAAEPTGIAMILVEDSGQNAIVVAPGANLRLEPAHVERLVPVFQNVDALLVQLEIPLETVTAALRLARANGVLSILDAGPAQSVPGEILRAADIVSPNETEAEAITGIRVQDLESARVAAAALRALGAQEVVIKLGALGAFYSGEREIHAPAFPIVPVDTVAAGDAFTAALAVWWTPHTREQALRYANAAGALAALSPGAHAAMPTRDAVEAMIQ